MRPAAGRRFSRTGHSETDKRKGAETRELPGIGPVPGAVIVAEIGDITRFRHPGPAILVGRADPAAL